MTIRAPRHPWFERVVLAAVSILALCACVQSPETFHGWVPPPPVTPPPGDTWTEMAETSGASPSPPPGEPAVGEPAVDFAEEVKALYRIVACGSDAPIPQGVDPALVSAHCAEILPKMAEYRRRYVDVARPFLTALEPPNLPTEVVYPFGGGDLVTALTAFPHAQTITTLSLELVGDPRRYRSIDRASLERSLRLIRAVLSELLFIDDYSRSETLKRTQRGDIPGELSLFLVGLAIHHLVPVSLRYFTLSPDGTVHHLTQKEIDVADAAQHRKATWTPPDFSEAFANAEIVAEAEGTHSQLVHRHLAVNLSDRALARDPEPLRHLRAKGRVSAMTKASSYLIWRDDFSEIRTYLLEHADFMLSDSTGIPPSYASEAGFVQEAYGTFSGSLLRASRAHNADFGELFRSQPHRKLPFRFGYLSARKPHLIVTRRAPRPSP